MRSAAWLVALAATLALASPSQAEDRLDEDLALWIQLNASFVLDLGPITLVPYLEVQPRFDDDISDLREVQQRGALFVRPIEKLFFGAGYVLVPEFEPEDQVDEYRIYEEARWDGGPFGFGTRLRVEQRFFEGQDPVSHRVRLRLGFNIPIAEPGDMPLLLVLTEEMFFNLNDDERHGRREGFEQNRAFAGFALKVGPGLTFQVGYMNVFRNRWGEPDRLDHTIFMQVDVTFE